MKIFKGTPRKIIVDPYDKDKIFVDGYTLDNGNITVWTSETPGQETTQEQAKVNAEMIAKAFDIAQNFGSLAELEARHLDAVNALKIAKTFIEANIVARDRDAVADAVINRVLSRAKRQEKFTYPYDGMR